MKYYIYIYIYRLCKEHDETIQHIISGCKHLASKGYMERHNQVAAIIHKDICQKYQLPTPKNWWDLPNKVTENEQAKLLWDFHIQTEQVKT